MAYVTTNEACGLATNIHAPCCPTLSHIKYSQTVALGGTYLVKLQPHISQQGHLILLQLVLEIGHGFGTCPPPQTDPSAHCPIHSTQRMFFQLPPTQIGVQRKEVPRKRNSSAFHTCRLQSRGMKIGRLGGSTCASHHQIWVLEMEKQFQEKIARAETEKGRKRTGRKGGG